MIIWLASYPKSGNTYVRAFLSAYYFSKDGQFDFNQISNIRQFPDKEFLNQKSLMESAIYASSSIDAEDSLKFIKKVLIKNKTDEGYIYFFKHQSKYNHRTKCK